MGRGCWWIRIIKEDFVYCEEYQGINKWDDVNNAKIVIETARCDALKVVANVKEKIWLLKETACDISCIVVAIPLGAATSPSCIPCRAKLLLLKVASTTTKGNYDSCANLALNIVKVLTTAQQLLLWLGHYATKVAWVDMEWVSYTYYYSISYTLETNHTQVRCCGSSTICCTTKREQQSQAI